LAEQLEVEYSAKLAQIHSEILNFRNNTKQLSVSVALHLADNGRELCPAGGGTSADFG